MFNVDPQKNSKLFRNIYFLLLSAPSHAKLADGLGLHTLSLRDTVLVARYSLISPE